MPKKYVYMLIPLRYFMVWVYIYIFLLDNGTGYPVDMHTIFSFHPEDRPYPADKNIPAHGLCFPTLWTGHLYTFSFPAPAERAWWRKFEPNCCNLRVPNHIDGSHARYSYHLRYILEVRWGGRGRRNGNCNSNSINSNSNSGNSLFENKQVQTKTSIVNTLENTFYRLLSVHF